MVLQLLSHSPLSLFNLFKCKSEHCAVSWIRIFNILAWLSSISWIMNMFMIIIFPISPWSKYSNDHNIFMVDNVPWYGRCWNQLSPCWLLFWSGNINNDNGDHYDLWSSLIIFRNLLKSFPNLIIFRNS